MTLGGLVLWLLITVVMLWIVYLVPIPPTAPAQTKNILYVVVLILALLWLVMSLGGFGWGPTIRIR